MKVMELPNGGCILVNDDNDEDELRIATVRPVRIVKDETIEFSVQTYEQRHV